MTKGGGKKKKKSSSAKGALSGTKSLSKASSKKRLSRLGKIQKPGETGFGGSYITRSVILRRLQITLKDFRRLCILKGIYPRDVAHGKSNQTYYHIKDIQSLAHEPLLVKFREFKTFMRKVRHFVGRGDIQGARRKYDQVPTYLLNHLIKERYPKFNDALNDLDDALSMLFLFAALPAQGRVSADRIAKCEELCQRWNSYVSTVGVLTKAFISIKGIYFQACIRGIDITWLVPHQFAHDPPSNRQVDYRVMLTFLELYETLTKFVLFKLYRDDAEKFVNPSQTAYSNDDRIFSHLRFALSRETKYSWLEFLLKSAGAQLVDDPSKATHFVTDRANPQPVPNGVEQIQPQWIVDSFNNKRCLPIYRYAPGTVLPPHLSPFVDSSDYKPAYQEELNAQTSAYSKFKQLNSDATPLSAPAPTAAQQSFPVTAKDVQDDPNALAKIMMSNKAKRLHGRMMHGIARKRDAIARLKARRARLEGGASS
uniref:Pescadillo homolog n=1 Tax=Aureoumbra lagunensis TaxID=44058 RepID=A0A7S3JZ61_9STRA|mmetsp:Transcript_4250/g.6000  ORF Transcript_4250/g.6000 Transcript_4250/m.6000 type:complete len:482 (+) Transcript_4250:26-1471(+)